MKSGECPAAVIEKRMVPDGCAAIVRVDEDLAIAVFRVGDAFYAIDNRCPHKGAPLGEGALEGTVVTCPWHGFTVDVTTGICPRNRVLRVRTFEVEEIGDGLKIVVSPG